MDSCQTKTQYRVLYRRWDAISVEHRKDSRIESSIITAENADLAISIVLRDKRNEILPNGVDEWTDELEARVESIKAPTIKEAW